MNYLKITISILLLLTTLSVTGQDQQINQVDAQGRKHGEWKKEYPNGQTIYSGQFNHGEPVGTFKRYYPDGTLKAKMEYSTPNKVYTQLYNKDGKKQAEGIYLNRNKDSTWVIYDEQGNIVSKENYNDGTRDGKSVKYYPGGEPAEIINWNSGKKDGMFKQFFDNGEVKMQGRYVEGLLDGYLTLFYPNGYKKVEGKYVENLREGDWVYYNEHGDTTQVLNYTNGVPENQDSLERIETEEINKLENMKGKYKDPRDMFYNNNERK